MKLEEFARKIEPFIAVAVIVLLIILALLLYKDNQLKKEISINCGWGEEDYKCYCEKSDIAFIENKLKGGLNFNFTDDKVDW